MPDGKGRWWAVMTLPLVLSACGGGDSGGAACTPTDEKTWARGHLDDVYLWYKEIIDVPPANYDQVEDYFDALLVRSRDRFSFMANQASMDDFQQSGLNTGLGLDWMYDAARDYSLRVSFVEPASPAASQGVRRGETLLSLNGVPFNAWAYDDLWAALRPAAGGRADLELYDGTTGVTRHVILISAAFTQQPVPLDTVLTQPDGRRVGYLLFNDHIWPATDALSAAVSRFQAAGVSDVVLDLRYNGGGYLAVASQLAYMLSGPATSGQVFTRFTFNDKHSDANQNFRFIGYDNANRNLPRLNLNRVYVLTGGRTCSASEAVINGLLPFLPVYSIGGSTCGKPYGFSQADHCGKAYFAVRFKGANRNGSSVPETGFSADCPVRDDLDHALGDRNESLLEAALTLRQTGACPAGAPVRSRSAPARPPLQAPPREPWRETLLVP